MPDATATALNVDLYGWDTAFAVRLSEVNKVIAERRSSPREFFQEDKADGYSLRGRFGDWSVIPKGSGDLIRMNIPFCDAVLTLPDGNSISRSGSAGILLRLRFVKLPNANGGPKQQMTHALLPSGDAVGAEKAVSIVTLTLNDDDPNSLAEIAFRMLLEDWLEANIAAFDHVFAFTRLDGTAGGDSPFQWLQPTEQAYAYTDIGASDGAIALLCRTGGRSTANLPSQVSPLALVAGASATLTIARPRILEDIVLPKMPLVFSGAKQTDFQIDPTDGSIGLANGPVGFDAKDNKSGQTHPCTLIDLKVAILGAELTIDATTTADVSAGIHVFTRTRTRMTISAGPDQKLTYVQTEEPDIQHSTKEDLSVVLTEALLAAIALVFTVAAIIVTDGAALLVVAVIVGLTAGLVALADTIDEHNTSAAATPLTDLALNATGSATWTDGGRFQLTSARLSGGLQLAGNFGGTA
jgi:hypothetical protein